MQEAINILKRHADSSGDASEGELIEVGRTKANLKPDINNLLHTYLPGDITVSEVEQIAIVINEIIEYPRVFLDNVTKNATRTSN